MLKITNLNCSYGKNQVVKDLSLEVLPNKVYTIIGPNGCGKTTTLKAIDNLIKYDGQITIDDTNIKELNRKALARKITILSQNSATYFSFTVFDTVMMGRYPYMNKYLARPSKKDVEVVENALEMVNMTSFRDKEISTLSGGEMQRVYLARAMAQDTQILLLDEPTNHLDVEFQIEILEFVKKWVQKDNRIAITVLHDLNLAKKYSDKILLMARGEKISFGEPNEVLTPQNLLNVYNVDVAKFMKESLNLWND